MANGDNKASQKLENFLKMSLKYCGKKICLNSYQHFSIDQISNLNKEQLGEYRYMIQYGFSQSGGVSMHINYSPKSNSVTIDKVAVYAPPIRDNIIMANFAPQTQVEEINVGVNIGIDTGTEKHTTLSEIEANPNAMQMLDIAILDLSQAQILGKCTTIVADGSELIPCCNCVHISNTKRKRM